MSASDETGLSWFRMDEADIDEFLREQGIGVLSLADENVAYGVPLSFGYDGERLLFVYQRPAEESRKTTFSNRTEWASFVTFEVAGKHRWRSVVVGGPLERVPEEDWGDLVAAIDDNAWFPSLFSHVQPMQDFLGYQLHVEEANGLVGEDFR